MHLFSVYLHSSVCNVKPWVKTSILAARSLTLSSVQRKGKHLNPMLCRFFHKENNLSHQRGKQKRRKLSVAVLVAATCGEKFPKRNMEYTEYMDL